MKKRFFTFSLLLLASALTFASSDVALKLNLEKGVDYKFRTTIDQVTTQSMGGMNQEVKQNQIFEYTMNSIDKDSKGNFDTKITYTRVAIDVDAGVMKFAYDSNSDDKSAAGNPQLMSFAALINKSINVKFSPKGEVIEVKGIDVMIDQIINEVSGGNEAMKSQIKQSMDNSFNESTLKQMLGASFMDLPMNNVKVGTSWTENKSIITQFTLNVINSYNVKSIDATDVNIDVTSTISTVPGNKSNMQGMDVTFNLFGTQAGILKVSKAIGLVTAFESTQNITGNFSADMMGQKMEVPMTIVIKTTTTLL
jgi:hypothetical protein